MESNDDNHTMQVDQIPDECLFQKKELIELFRTFSIIERGIQIGKPDVATIISDDLIAMFPHISKPEDMMEKVFDEVLNWKGGFDNDDNYDEYKIISSLAEKMKNWITGVIKNFKEYISMMIFVILNMQEFAVSGEDNLEKEIIKKFFKNMEAFMFHKLMFPNCNRFQNNKEYNIIISNDYLDKQNLNNEKLNSDMSETIEKVKDITNQEIVDKNNSLLQNNSNFLNLAFYVLVRFWMTFYVNDPLEGLNNIIDNNDEMNTKLAEYFISLGDKWLPNLEIKVDDLDSLEKNNQIFSLNMDYTEVLNLITENSEKLPKLKLQHIQNTS